MGLGILKTYIFISQKENQIDQPRGVVFWSENLWKSQWRSVESSPNLWDSWSPRNLLREKYDNKFGAWKDLRKALNISCMLKFSCYLEVFHFYVLNCKNQIDWDWIRLDFCNCDWSACPLQTQFGLNLTFLIIAAPEAKVNVRTCSSAQLQNLSEDSWRTFPTWWKQPGKGTGFQ